MNVRPATPEDVPVVLPMVRRIAEFHRDLDAAKYAFDGDPGEMYRGWLTKRATDPRSVFLVAERSAGTLVGFLIAGVEREIPIYVIGSFGLIHDLWVDERYRHEGLARQMVTLAVERFAEIGVPQVRLYAAWSNGPARKLFEACGFRPSSVEMLIETGGTGVGQGTPAAS